MCSGKTPDQAGVWGNKLKKNVLPSKNLHEIGRQRVASQRFAHWQRSEPMGGDWLEKGKMGSWGGGQPKM